MEHHRSRKERTAEREIRSGNEGGRQPERSANEASPSTPTRRSDGTSRSSQTPVPEELVGQEAEVSKDDLKLSELRGTIRGRADKFVCAVDPPEGTLVTKGSTIVLKTHC
jgi:hypothetical protein